MLTKNMSDDTIKIGQYIIIQKHNYKKLHKLNKPNSCISLGRDSIDLTGVEGSRYFSLFKMIPKGTKRNREYCLELTDEIIELKDEIEVKISGTDNRNIFDDGHSQKLTAVEIEELKSDDNKVSYIVETLISNSNTFHNKTEFSQEKYLRKKEKKYFEYLQILRPNLRLITEIMYKLDPIKIQGIRIDTLSQIITMTNVHCEGNHLLYDSGSNGLLAATLLSAIGEGTNGKLIHMHPGNMSQKQALLAMNFSEEQYNRCISVNIYSVLRQYHQGIDTNSNKNSSLETQNSQHKDLKRKHSEDIDFDNKVQKCDAVQEVDSNNDAYHDIHSNNDASQEIHRKSDASQEIHCKSNASQEIHTTSERLSKVNCDSVKYTEPKKPKWHYDNIAASELLHKKVDSLVIACKEDPQNIFDELVKFVKCGRSFVIYYSVAEPLQQLYMTLKTRSNIAALKLTYNWMRNYQILPERTHPDVTMNASSGFLLTGYILK